MRNRIIRKNISYSWNIIFLLFLFFLFMPSSAYAAAGVQIGQKGHSDGTTGGPNYTSGSYRINIMATFDTSFAPENEAVCSVVPGTCVSFINTLKNTGGGVDTFNITFTWWVNQIPDASITFWKSDGVTALVDTNSDGIPDTGPVAATAEVDIVVKICIPVTTPPDTVDHWGPVTATSTNDSLVYDWTYDKITDIDTMNVVLHNNNGGVLNDTPYSQVTPAGACLIYPLAVKHDTVADACWESYWLSQTQTLPSGWTLEFYPDTDNNQQPDLGAAAITATPSLAPGATYRYVAKVCIPVGQAPLGDGNTGTVGDGQKLTFKAEGINFGKTDTQDDYAEVSPEPEYDFTFEPDNSATASPCGTVFYKHLLKNNGTVAQSFTVGLDGGYTPRTGWLYTFSLDGITYSESVTITNLTPGATQEIWVKVFVPCSEAINVTEIGKITATNTTIGAGGATKTRNDITIVVQANLRLTKSVDKATAQPGGDLIYTVEYQNLGTENMTNAYIYDAIPAHTEFKVGSAIGSTTIEYSNDNGATWGYAPGGAYDPAVTNIRWKLTTPLVGGGSGTVSFTVRVK